MNYRHGDLALIGIKKIPTTSEKKETKTLLIGSGNNPHTFDFGNFYKNKEEDPFVFGYFEAFQNTKLYHKEHGEKITSTLGHTQGVEPFAGPKHNHIVDSCLKQCTIKKGFYELRRQIEDTNEGMKSVED